VNNSPHTSKHAEHTPADDQHVEPETETAQQAHAPTDEPTTDDTPAQASGKLFPIVGIGASAGGLEAFEKFFTNMPSDSGIAFILVQHLDPTHEIMLVDIIQRYTHMQVMQVTSGMAVQSNCVHIIPPNRDMALRDGKLNLSQPEMARGLRLPIDFFFRSLAAELHERAICIILSGTGTDGTLGLRAIKGEGGMAMVQAPPSSRYDGMPQNAIATGMVDYTLAPEDMPQQLLQYVRQEFTGDQRKAEPRRVKSTDTDSLHQVFMALRNQTGHDFSRYKTNTIMRRIERRMTVNQIERASDYVRFLRQNSQEVETLFREMLIGVTSFFRDHEAFSALRQKVIPRLMEQHKPGQTIRVWVPGCSTGEEAYSIAILLHEQMDAWDKAYKIRIFATDIDSRAIDKARAGIYPNSIAADVSPERLQRFFSKEGNTYQVNKQIRDIVVFAVQSVIKDPPFSSLDLISCRNLLIYLSTELQKKVIPLFHYALKPGGFLFLGTSETLGESAHLFATIDRKWAMFQRSTEATPAKAPPDFPTNTSRTGYPEQQPAPTTSKSDKPDLRTLTEQALLKTYAPPCVLINPDGEILYLYGRTGKYLELADGEASLNILRMAREGLQFVLPTLIREVQAGTAEIYREGIRITTDGDVQVVNLRVRHVSQDMLMVTFEDVAQVKPVASPAKQLEQPDTTPEEKDQRLTVLQQELDSTREYLQTTIEELQASTEEVKSSNEELQSTNEELQSTNEELETSKEELQSVNEELVTVNTELRSKVEQLSQVNNDRENLLASMKVGIIFLDKQLRIVRFTPAINQVVNLLESDIGRPLEDLMPRLSDVDLIQEAQYVLKTLEHCETEVHTRDDCWYLMRIIPYRTTENVVEGVVLAFVNITYQKQVQEELRYFSQALEQVPTILFITSLQGDIEYVNPQFNNVTGYTAEHILGQNMRVLMTEQDTDVLFEQIWQRIATGKEWRGELHSRREDGDIYWLWLAGSPIHDKTGTVTQVLFIGDDITNRKQVEADLRASERFLRGIYNGLDLPIFVVEVTDAGDFVYESNNPASAQIIGYTTETLRGKRPEDLSDTLSADAAAQARQHYQQCRETGDVVEYEQIAHTGNQTTWWHVRLEPLKDEQGQVYRILGIARSMTELRQTQARVAQQQHLLAALDAWYDQVETTEDAQHLLTAFCRLLVEHGAYCLTWIGHAAPDNPEHLEQVAYAPATAEATDWPATEPELALARTAVQSGEIAIIQNIPADPERADWHEPAAAAGYAAAAALPLPVVEETHSVLVVYAAAPDAFDASEQMLLQHVAHVLATALQV
jgi:two-component system CheB/CheR fusion protein